jgi:energy-coupling factor transporter ATP-binding protein EcfA2
MRQPRSPRPLETLLAQLPPEARTRLERFRAAVVEHPRLLQVEQELLHAIWEPAGFAHVLVVGPTGVGKSTVLKHLAKHWHEQASQDAGPLLVMETWPGGPAFDRTHYYRTGLRLLGEGAWLGLEANESAAKPGRKATHFQESPELRLAYQAALARHGVCGVLLDEAAHLMKVGASGKLLDQLDWLKSMTNATGIVHVLFGPYTLLAFRHLSGQAARRGLNVHFARYQLQQTQDQRDFQGTLWSLLAEVPLPTHPEALMQHWLTFYERTIGCIGVLRDWLLRASATALRSGKEELTWEWLLAHALPVAECDRLAMEATDGEHQLGYTEKQREHLWQLLQEGMETMTPPPTPAPPPAEPEAAGAAAPTPEPPSSTEPLASSEPKASRKRTSHAGAQAPVAEPTEDASSGESPPKPKRRRRKAAEENLAEVESASEEPPAQKKRSQPGHRKPQRDPVGEGPKA